MQSELKDKDSSLKEQEREARSRENQLEKLNTEMIL